MKKAILLVFISMLASCGHSIHMVQVTSFDNILERKEPQEITARTSQFVVLGFTDNTTYVDRAYKMISAKCPQGFIEGLTTQFSTSLGFLSWTNKIVIRGLCYN